MKSVIEEFVSLLRKAGIPVTVQESIDCLRAWELVNCEVRSLRSVMELTLIKSQWEKPIFARAFDLFFLDKAMEETLADKHITLPGGTADGSGQGTAGAGGASDSLLTLLDGQPPPVLEALARRSIAARTLASGKPEEAEVVLRKVQVDLGWFHAVNIIERRYQMGRLTEDEYLAWQHCFADFEQCLRTELARKAICTFGEAALHAFVAYANVRQKDFNALTPQELLKVEQGVSQIAHRLANRVGLRFRKTKQGYVDVSRTFRNVVATGGCPVRLRYRNKIKSKVDLWLLCDVSNSVERYSRFMLQLLWVAQRRYARIRSFVFVDRAVEVTEWFRTRNIQDFLSARELRETFSRTGFSRYDLVFEQLARHELAAISSQTKILILGDARNNWLRGGREELAKIAARAHSVYWLSPLPREAWQDGDCILDQYREYCRQVFECRNLHQLSDVATRIL